MDIGFKNVCAKHFKCNNVFSQFRCRSVKITRVLFETRHRKSKSYRLDGDVKCFTTRKVYER